MENKIIKIIDKVMGELEINDRPVIEIKVKENDEVEYSVKDTAKCCCEDCSAKKRNELKAIISSYMFETLAEFMAKIYAIIENNGNDGLNALNELFEEISEATKDEFKLQVINK